VVRTSYFGAVTTLTVLAVLAAGVAVLVGYGSALAQEGEEDPPGAPSVVRTSPDESDKNVDRDTNIKVKFSEKMMKSSINTDTVHMARVKSCSDGLAFVGDDGETTTIHSGGCTLYPSVPAKVSYNAEKKHAILKPSKRLYPGYYAVTIEGAGDTNTLAVKDTTGNEMAADKKWYFTTETP
jgi:hypothetical protein